MEVVQLVVKAF